MEEQLLLDDSFAEGMPLTEDDFDAGHPIEKPASQGRSLLPPASREAKGAEVSADESITACGCEEVDAAVPLAGRGMEGLLHEDTSAVPAETSTPHPLHPTRKLLESRVTLNNISTHSDGCRALESA